jgi:hypothetical protein
MADYTVLENVEDQDWKTTQEAIEKRFNTGDMIESGSDELDDSAWYSDPEFYEAMVGWGEPGHGAVGDVGRDLWNQTMLFGDFLTATSPARWLGGGLENSIFHDMMFEGDLYDKIYSKGDYREIEKKRKNAESDKRFMQNILETGSLTKNQVRALNEAFGENKFKEGELSLSDTSLFNEIVLGIDTELARKDDEIIAGWKEKEGGPWYDVDWPALGKETANYWMTPSNVASDNPYKDLANKIRIGGNIAPFVASPITSGVRTVGSKVAPAVTKAITNSRFGSLLKNLKPSGIFPSLVNRLPKPMQETVKQLLPVTSGKGTFLPKRGVKPTTWNPLTWGRPVTNRDWLGANTLRNWGIAGAMVGGEKLFGDNEVQAATISDDWGRDSDPVTFDPYIQERMQNIRKPRDERRGPGPWNEFEG